MIEMYEGRIGGGKTYSAVRKMLEYMSYGGVVSTNITLNIERCREYCRKVHGVEIQDEQYQYLTEEKIGVFHRHTPSGTKEMPSLVVIDEAHIWLNARDWANANRELLTFLTQSRKSFTDVIFISQSSLNCDKQIMRLIQYIWRFRDMQQVKVWGVSMKMCRFFMGVQYDYDGKTVVNRKYIPKETGIYECYSTTELLRTFERSGTAKKMELAKVNRGDKKYLIYGAIAGAAMVTIAVVMIPRSDGNALSEESKTERPLITVINTNESKNEIAVEETNKMWSLCAVVESPWACHAYDSDGKKWEKGRIYDGKRLVKIEEKALVFSDGTKKQ